mmetsp:Transcript_71114/g.144459  ORF Transcript_71114/g.144459 Transcript_71114/m.144459 type:complete len:682 (-) Transcript_71114:66-2111(-)
MTGGRSTGGLRKRHALQLFKTDMCKFFLQGRCENGDRCSYAHNRDEVRHKPDLTRTSMCRTMLQMGSCTDMTCRFAHDEAQLRATQGFFKMKMCGFAQSGRCKHGKSCRFAHSPEELRPPKPAPVQSEDNLMIGDRQIIEGVMQSTPNQGQGFHFNNFIFGTMEQQGGFQGPHSTEEQLPPNPMPGTAEAIRSRRQQRREAREAEAGSLRVQIPPGGGTASSACASSTGERPRQAEAESDSSENGTSHHSSLTDLPRSDHTPQGTSDSSSGARDGSTAAARASASTATDTSNSGGGEKSNTAEKYMKAQGPRSGASPTPKVTTLLITNIPAYLTQGALLSMFEDLTEEMRDNFDFFYCPWDAKEGHNLGYALLNFPDANDAAAFQRRWTNKDLCRGGRNQKPLKVMKAALQGLQANLDYFSMVEIAQCSDLRFRPLYRDPSGNLQPLQLACEPEQSVGMGPCVPLTAALGVPQQDDQQAMQSMEDMQNMGMEGYFRRSQGFIGIDHPVPPRSGRGNEQGSQRRPNRRRGPNQQVGVDVPTQAMQQGGHNTGHLLSALPAMDYWQPQQDGVENPASQEQQMIHWPGMMVAVPWPVADQEAAGGHVDGGGMGTAVMGGDAMGAGPGGMGPGAGQVPCQQMVSCMMMPMEAMMPADGSYGSRQGLPPSAMAGAWMQPGEEVYSD